MRKQSLKIAVPWPPSVNKYWRHVGPRVLVSAEGRKYRDEVAGALLAHSSGAALFDGPVSLRLRCWPPDRRRRDVDNVLKSLLDTLTAAKIWEDDSQVDELYVRRMPRPLGAGAVEIVVADSGGYMDGDALGDAPKKEEDGR